MISSWLTDGGGVIHGAGAGDGDSCVFGEMLTGKPILAGESDKHQLEIIWDLVGSPSDSNMPDWRSLPGAEGLQPQLRPGCLSTRFMQ
jgi:serine/threonine-protein kinase BUR1